ncbi:MAG: phage head-tail adapter protein [Brevundimonas sp.]|nr:MAG: phage head-tail adapter protein [Brevundimonas sp.]
MTVHGKALLAELFRTTETQTPFGGRSVAYDLLGSIWLKLGVVRRRERGEAGAGAVSEQVTAASRSDVRLIDGRMLRWGGRDWRIVSSDTVGGRAILNLERVR